MNFSRINKIQLKLYFKSFIIVHKVTVAKLNDTVEVYLRFPMTPTRTTPHNSGITSEAKWTGLTGGYSSFKWANRDAAESHVTG